MKYTKIFVSIIVIVLLAYFLFIYYLSSQMSSSIETTWDAMDEVPFACPEGFEEKRERWSKLGYSRTCNPSKNGKWEAWDEGYKNIEGFYKNGQTDGKWVWYNNDGSVYRMIEYKNGKEIGNQLIENK